MLISLLLFFVFHIAQSMVLTTGEGFLFLEGVEQRGGYREYRLERKVESNNLRGVGTEDRE